MPSGEEVNDVANQLKQNLVTSSSSSNKKTNKSSSFTLQQDIGTMKYDGGLTVACTAFIGIFILCKTPALKAKCRQFSCLFFEKLCQNVTKVVEGKGNLYLCVLNICISINVSGDSIL